MGMRAAQLHHVPLDVTFMALLACAVARADQSEVVEFTVYAPMRDGAAEAMMVGLFVDWRDIAIGVDFELATVIGTILQMSHKIQHRQWSIYNALRKPECTIVNVQLVDTTPRGGFRLVHESGFWGGDR